MTEGLKDCDDHHDDDDNENETRLDENGVVFDE